ncbi:hypothetical protein B4113_1681 [Geobacillus sp. B4113_201601]|nr:hypothetical protein B4113_1681 [Geobacillus sp. B4113_201601]
MKQSSDNLPELDCSICFYRTYEGLKLRFGRKIRWVLTSFYRTYEGLKLMNIADIC